VWHTAQGQGLDRVNPSPATYFSYRAEHRCFEDLGLWDATEVAVTELAEPEQVEAMQVTKGPFPFPSCGCSRWSVGLHRRRRLAPESRDVIVGPGYGLEPLWRRPERDGPDAHRQWETPGDHRRDAPGFRLLSFDRAVFDRRPESPPGSSSARTPRKRPRGEAELPVSDPLTTRSIFMRAVPDPEAWSGPVPTPWDGYAWLFR
jgi:hypothetical protein